MVLVVAADGVVRDLIPLRGQRGKFAAASVGIELLGIEERTLPIVSGASMNPGRAINVEVTDELRVVRHPRAMFARDVVAPLGELGAVEIRVSRLHFPLMEIGEGQLMAIRQPEPLVFLVSEGARVTVIRQSARDDLLCPSDAVEAPRAQVRRDRLFEPTLHRVAVFSPPQVAVHRVAQRRWINVVQRDREERLALRRDKPPAALVLRERKEISLRCGAK